MTELTDWLRREAVSDNEWGLFDEAARHNEAAELIERLSEDNAELREAVQSAHERADYWTEQAAVFVGERDRLQAIVDRLPKTANGVPVVPNMRIWPFFEIEDEQGAVVCLCAHDGPTGEMLVDGDTMNVGKCYSTREAAVAAR